MRENYESISSRGVKLVVIGNGQPWQAKLFKEEEKIPFDLWVDTEMQAYRAAGLKRGVMKTLSIRSAGHALRALTQGHRQTKVQGDPWQNGGAFIITQEGKTIYQHVSREAGDHAPIPVLLSAIDKIKKRAFPHVIQKS